MSTPLTVTVLHELPGRLRVQLSHALADADAFGRTLRSHAGIQPMRYTAVTRTVLLRYDPAAIRREELLVRTALALSLEHGARPVRIEPAPPHPKLTGSVAASGAVLLAAGLGRLLRLPGPTLGTLDGVAGVATGGAVVSHALQELRQRGVVHPEVVSVAYLVAGAMRNSTWSAAVLTWFASFGRHLLESDPQAVEVQPGADGEAPDVVAAAAPATGWQAWLRLVPALLSALAGAGPGGRDLLANLREVSNLHNQVLDALGPWKQGIPLRFAAAPRA